MNVPGILRTPFPRPKRSSKNLLWVVMVGLGCSLFILLFKPFGIENSTGEWWVYLVIFSLGVLFILSILFMEWLIPTLFPAPFKKWTVGKALIWYTLVILFIGAMIFLYKSFWGGFSEFTWTDFLKVLGRILGIGITVTFFVLGIWQYLNRNRLSLVSITEEYIITSQNGKPVRLNLKEILYISSDDNYVDVHLESDGVRKKEILRSSLKNIEEQIVNPLSPILRCHRGYLINIEYFEILKASSRNMIIGLKNYGDEIPVSKQYAETIKQRLQVRPK